MSQTTPSETEVHKYAAHFVLHDSMSAAFRHTFPKSQAKPVIINQKASRLHALPHVQAKIAELRGDVAKQIKEDFDIDANWVLQNAVRVFRRCMQDVEPKKGPGGLTATALTEDGELRAAFEFNASGANKALELIGKHSDVQAFNEKSTVTVKKVVDDGSDEW